MTAAAERLIDSHIERRALAPFLVSGTVQGQSVVKAVRSPAEALDEIVRWCEEDPQATGNWRVRHDYSGIGAGSPRSAGRDSAPMPRHVPNRTTVVYSDPLVGSRESRVEIRCQAR